MTTTTVDFLATVPLFSGLDRTELQRFADLTREKFYPRGSVILFENDPGDSLFVVRQGRVKVVLIGEDGREVILGVLGVGEHFGELSLIDDRPRSAHVIAMDDAHLLVLRREDFRRRVESSPAVAWSLLTELSRRLRRADEKIGGLVLLDVPGRIARLLLDLAEEMRERHDRQAADASDDRADDRREPRDGVARDEGLSGRELGDRRTPAHYARRSDRSRAARASALAPPDKCQSLREPPCAVWPRSHPSYGGMRRLVMTCDAFWGTRGSDSDARPAHRAVRRQHALRRGSHRHGLRSSSSTPAPAFASSGGRSSTARTGSPIAADIFLTHAHWDHIQGIPFFAPIFERGQPVHDLGLEVAARPASTASFATRCRRSSFP